MQTSPEQVGEPLLLYLCYVPNPLKAAANEGCGLPMDFGIFTTDKLRKIRLTWSSAAWGVGNILWGAIGERRLSKPANGRVGAIEPEIDRTQSG